MEWNLNYIIESERFSNCTFEKSKEIEFSDEQSEYYFDKDWKYYLDKEVDLESCQYSYSINLARYNKFYSI